MRPDLTRASPGPQTSVARATRFVLLLAVTVFAAEVVVMFVLRSALPASTPETVEALLDGLLLSVTISPALYVFGYRPLARHAIRQQAVERDLRESQERLEATVADRTQELSHANAELTGRLGELEQSERMLQLLTQVSCLLQACETAEDAKPVVQSFLGGLFSNARSCLFLFRNSRDQLEPIAACGMALPQPFAPQNCWSLRLGRPHTVGLGETSVPCPHLDPEEQRCVCFPLSAQGEILGVVQMLPDSAASIRGIWREMLELACEELALGLSNVRLREKLQRQAIRDPLTGLFNRRYLVESMDREVRRAQRRSGQISVLMIDVDHFKRLNDTHGHAAGDLVLQRLTQSICEVVRREDIVCRYGGEEFVVVLPDENHVHALAKAEVVREAITEMRVEFLGVVITDLSVSVGVATLSDPSAAPESLLKLADAALYAAKKQGRNCVASAAEIHAHASEQAPLD